MTTATQTWPPAAGLPVRRLRHEVAAVKIVWERDIARYLIDRTRIASLFLQPALYLLILGTGLATVTSGLGVDYRTFIYPGVLAMTVVTSAVITAGSLVFDREIGFLREVLVAPVRRGTIIAGKILGGMSIAVAQGIIMMLLAGLCGVPYSATLMLTLLGEMILLSFAVTAFAVMLAARMTRAQSFVTLVQMLIQPLLFVSGAFFPLHGLPSWLAVVTAVNPVTYAVDPMRQAVLGALDPAEAGPLRALDPGISWGSWPVPIGLQLTIVAVLGLVFTAIGIRFIHKPRPSGM
ncbi:ABC transporter [Amycolatopsis acidicola]|uniref:Transport permease protein n=1 Tax=Amycolatopsis acidicola TaxID=2596893 RepID=A0A5N0VL99_9PSEU|nr:ABC transporter permease [Amycolatopsis acidicola]KAA9166498.1 ABC transporter [Amycolatopsis acidicola]